MSPHRKMTQPASRTPTFPMQILSRTSTQASLVLYSSASLVRNKTFPFTPSPRPRSLFWKLLLYAVSKGSLNESGKQSAVHQEYVFLFGVFDENKSKYKPNSYSPDDHVKYTINGFAEGSLPGENVPQSLPSFSYYLLWYLTFFFLRAQKLERRKGWQKKIWLGAHGVQKRVKKVLFGGVYKALKKRKKNPNHFSGKKLKWLY